MNNENEYTSAGGVKYVAQPMSRPVDPCKGCAFFSDPEDCRAATCCPHERNDRRHVIWVKAE